MKKNLKDHKLKSKKALKSTHPINAQQSQSGKDNSELPIDSKTAVDDRDHFNKPNLNTPFPKGPQISNGRIIL